MCWKAQLWLACTASWMAFVFIQWGLTVFLLFWHFYLCCSRCIRIILKVVFVLLCISIVFTFVFMLPYFYPFDICICVILYFYPFDICICLLCCEKAPLDMPCCFLLNISMVKPLNSSIMVKPLKSSICQVSVWYG